MGKGNKNKAKQASSSSFAPICLIPAGELPAGPQVTSAASPAATPAAGDGSRILKGSAAPSVQTAAAAMASSVTPVPAGGDRGKAGIFFEKSHPVNGQQVNGQQANHIEKIGKIGKSQSIPRHDNGSSEKTWSSLFKDNRSSTAGATLTKVTECVANNRATFYDSDFSEEKHVSRSLMGFFTPKFPGLEAINTLVGTWKHKCTVARYTSSWIVFSFASKEEACAVLEGGPYVSFGSILHLMEMPRFFNFGREQQRAIPVWVQLHNLPLELWRPKLLATVCSTFGRPLHTDQLTQKMERISFARCLVEIDVDADLPSSIAIDLPGGVILTQSVLYENKPLSCDKCMRLGHASAACKNTGEPTLYVMRKPLNKVGKKKAVKNASTTAWVEVEKTIDDISIPPDQVGATVTATQVDETVSAPSVLASSPPEHHRAMTLEEEEAALDENTEYEDSDEEGDDVAGDVGEDYDDPRDTEVRGGGTVIGLQAQLKPHSHYPTPSALVPSTSTPPPSVLSGSKDPPKDIPPGFDLHVDSRGKWKLLPSWPSVQEIHSLAKSTMSKKK